MFFSVLFCFVFAHWHHFPSHAFLKNIYILLQFRFWGTCEEHAGLLHSIYMAMWFAASIPITYIWHFSPCYPPATPHSPLSLPYSSPQQTQCVMLPSLCPCVLIVQHQPMSENMWCLIFCSCVSLLRMMVSRFIYVPTMDTNSSFFMAS